MIEEEPDTPSVPAYVISGPPGAGKTQLAAHLARSLRDQESSAGGLDLLIWVHASDSEQIVTVYAEAAERLDLVEARAEDRVTAAKAFRNWLSSTDRRWLVVLDDVREPAAATEWWPEGTTPGRGRVIVTTRHRGVGFSAAGRDPLSLELGVYEVDEALSYLRRRLADAGQSQLYRSSSALALIEALGCQPLALGLAAAHMLNQEVNTDVYLDRFRDYRNQLSDLLPLDLDGAAVNQHVKPALAASLNAIEIADDTGLVRDLVRLIALMDPTGHPSKLWLTPPVLAYFQMSWERRHSLRWIKRRRPVTDSDILRALQHLRTYALVSQDSPATPVRMHVLTSRAICEGIPADALAALATTAADALVSLWPERDESDQDLAALLRTNTVTLNQHADGYLWDSGVHPCLIRTSDSFHEMGLHQQAVEFDESLLYQAEQYLGGGHGDTVEARVRLATSYRDAGRRQDAAHLMTEALHLSERFLGPDHQHSMAARSALAILRMDAGQVEEAVLLSEQVLSDGVRVLGSDHPNTLAARSNLAASYHEAGRLGEALALREQVVGDYERMLGRDHPDTLVARNNLAASYHEAGRLGEALALREQVVGDYERMLGRDHPDTLVARNNLAASYHEAGRLGEALALREQVVGDYDAMFGTDHPNTLAARSNLAASYHEAGRLGEALALREQVVGDYDAMFGTDHPNTLAARSNLAASYHEAGRLGEALALREQVVGDYDAMFGTDHPSTLAARSNLAASYHEAGRLGEALALQEDVVADYEHIRGPHHPESLNARHALALAYKDDQQHGRARALAEQLLTEHQSVYGPDHHRTKRVRTLLTELGI
ncbi:tetratricopeptide repeat protein [Streptomyces phaeochromogenes]|uniref:tetratricopeptide repeat protein n=1 Tax=Streptomyces phaeochromogenes TaxID=1923 RepID=UPI003686DF93